MGELAEWCFEKAMDEMLRDNYLATNIAKAYKNKQAIWLTRDGKEIPLSSMTDSHMCNSYKMLTKLEDASDYAKAWIRIFEKEIKKRKLVL